MTKKIIWRLKEQPTTEKLQGLVKEGILTKEEAREILFSSEEITERSADSLKEEIKFLRELVEKLSNRSQIITTIKKLEKPYIRYEWYEPYGVLCGDITTPKISTAYSNFTVTSQLSDINNF